MRSMPHNCFHKDDENLWQVICQIFGIRITDIIRWSVMTELRVTFWKSGFETEQLIYMYTFIVTNMDSEPEKVIRWILWCGRAASPECQSGKLRIYDDFIMDSWPCIPGEGLFALFYKLKACAFIAVPRGNEGFIRPDDNLSWAPRDHAGNGLLHLPFPVALSFMLCYSLLESAEV